MDVRAGSLLRANGGFLVLYAQDVLSEPRVYDNLKRILRKGELEIGPPQEGHQPLIGLKPTPIPVKVKVILVGERHAYDVLHAMDVDFASIFKVKVELDDRMPRTEESLRGYLGVLRRIIDREKLPPFEAGALGRVIEEGVRLSGHQDYLSTRFAELANIMRESAWLAGRRGAETVSRDDQIAAIRNRYARHDLIERSMLDMIRTGKILLETQGRSVGQINGLGLYDLDDAVFGFPARISATCAIGRQGVVNIEREAELSGSIHNKGILILSGFLAARFAQDKPLSLHANIAFEQSYATVDGDSATLAELLAVLSSLSGIPLRQDIAVTGSLNQRGQVQPVGGVTEKVRGFYQACRIQGFTGTQGVILPAQNVDELHMEDEICDAMDAGRFFIWSASDYKEAVELLTEHTCTEVMTVCDDRLRGYAETVQKFT
jgi:lon-related putative ATP-dependent protease